MQLALPPRGTPRPCGERTIGTSGTPARQHTHTNKRCGPHGLKKEARRAAGGRAAPVSRLAAPLRLDGRVRTTPMTRDERKTREHDRDHNPTVATQVHEATRPDDRQDVGDPVRPGVWAEEGGDGRGLLQAGPRFN